MNEVSINDILHSNKFLNKKVSISGWVKTFRANRFIALNDGSGLDNLQCVIDFENTDNEILPYELEQFPGKNFYRNVGSTRRYGIELSSTLLEFISP